jgi:hypothetical protein
LNKENKTQNIWIIGSQSFLAKSFSKLLESENINFTVFNSKETGYSYEVFEESFLNDLPNIIIDFKFPIVNSRSNNKSLQTSEYFSPQKNLAEVLKKYNYSDNLFLISTNLKNNEEYKNSEYVKNKIYQENIYKNLDKQLNLEIINLWNIFGYPDLNASRIIPYYFFKIKYKNEINFFSDGLDRRKFMYSEDFSKVLKDFCYEKKVIKNNMFYECCVGDLIYTLNSIVESQISNKINIAWDSQKKYQFEFIDNKLFVEKLNKTSKQYLENLNNLNFFNI